MKKKEEGEEEGEKEEPMLVHTKDTVVSCSPLCH
jgi:hypothetical protein